MAAEWLDVLEREAHVLRDNAPALAERLNVLPDALEHRVRNILKAAGQARALGGIVWIG